MVIEEADETAFWPELLVEATVVAPAAAKNLWKEADELTRPFVTWRETYDADADFSAREADRPNRNGCGIVGDKSQITNRKSQI